MAEKARKDSRTYIRVHDHMDEHPKVEPLSDAAFRLLMTNWFYCSRNLSDGRITDAAWRKRGSAKARRELLDAGLAEQHDGYVEMHDYLDWQRSAAEVADLREKRAESGRKGGKARATAQASAKQVAKQTGTKDQADTETETEPSLRSGSAPNGAGRQRPRRDAIDDESPAAQLLVGAYVDLHTRRPPNNVVGQVARHIGALLSEGFEHDAIRSALTELVRKGLNPAALPSLVNQHANRPVAAAGGRPSWEL